MDDSDRITEFFNSHPEWRQYADLVVMPPEPSEAIEEFEELDGSELTAHDDTMTSYGVTRLALYAKMRRDGQRHRFSEMIAMQQPPGCGITDKVFFQGVPRLAEQMGDRQLKTLVANARRHGFEPPADAIYQSGLARFPGDPEAFVTRSMGRHYIKRLCESRGWACDGAVSVSAREPEQDLLDDSQCLPMAPDLVRQNASRMARKNPELTRLTKKELRNKVLEQYGPSR